MEIRTGAKRRPDLSSPGPQAALLRYGIKGLKLFGLQSEENHDAAAAERSDRLSAFYRGEPVPNLYAQDIEPLLQENHDAAYQAWLDLEPGEAGATERSWMLKGAIVALRKFSQSIDKSIDLGAGARERIALRHLKAAAAADIAREERKTG